MKTKAWLVMAMSGAFLGLGLMRAVGPLMARDLSQLLTGPTPATILTNGVPGGLASDGTNFLVAGQSPEGQVIAMIVATNGIMLSPVLDLGPGGMPVTAFGAGKYLVIWPDFTEPPSDLYGQLINPDGTADGNPFLVEADADAAAVGGMAFDGTNFLAVWEGIGQDPSSTSFVAGRFITSAGFQTGPGFQLSSGGSAQRFPAVAWNGENYLVTWTGQLEDNSWGIGGFRISRDGNPLGRIAISGKTAQQAWPPAIASDGTNWLVVSARETGPYAVTTSNAFLPMLCGRLIASNGGIIGSELVLRRAGLGQFHPSVGFQNGNYLVAWSENQIVSYPNLGFQGYYSYWTIMAFQLNASGEAVLGPLRLFTDPFPDRIPPSGLSLSGGGSGWLCAFDYHTSQNILASFVFPLNESPPVVSNFKRLPTGEAQLYLSGSTWLFALETSSNLVDWGTDELGEDFSHIGGQITIPAPIGGGTQKRFFRAYSGRSACKENLRLIQEARDHWAMDHNFAGPPTDSDLFGPGRYLLSKPACPLHGTYSLPYDPNVPGCSLSWDDHSVW